MDKTMRILSADKQQILSTTNEILQEYGEPSKHSNQFCRKGDLVLRKDTMIYRKCEDCGDIRLVQYQNYVHHPDAPCLSCSKMGERNAMFGVAPPSKGKKIDVEIIRRGVAARMRNDSYKHSEETKRKMSIAHLGKPHPLNLSKEQRRARAMISTQILRRGTRKRDTAPEREFQSLLKQAGIEFEQQYQVDVKLFDFYIPHHNLLIEIDGIYWHGKELEYDEMNKAQKHNYDNDKQKDRLAWDQGYSLERIWGDEISKGFRRIFNELHS